VGEVWICSGQSNMQMQIAGWGKINKFEQEIAAADYAMIRQLQVPNTLSTKLEEDITGGGIGKFVTQQTPVIFQLRLIFLQGNYTTI